jgi:peptide/nickel transport system permease protein
MCGVIIVVFFLFQGFGDPTRLVMGQTADAATQQNIRKELNLDKPRWKQFLTYINDVSPVAIHTKDEIKQKKLKGIFIGSGTKLAIKVPYLRRSYQSKRDVWDVLMEALPGTIVLAISAMLIAIIFGIPLGILAAVKKDTWMESSSIFVSVLGISAPSFFMGIMIAYFFGFVLSHYTGLSMTGSLFETDPFEGRKIVLSNLVLPALTLGIRLWPSLRSSQEVQCSMC